MANPVYDRAYAQNRADGTPAPTMNYLNPQWAQFYDRIKQATGGKSTVLNGGVGQIEPAMGSTSDTAAPTYNSAVDLNSTSYDPKAVSAQQQSEVMGRIASALQKIKTPDPDEVDTPTVPPLSQPSASTSSMQGLQKAIKVKR